MLVDEIRRLHSVTNAAARPGVVRVIAKLLGALSRLVPSIESSIPSVLYGLDSMQSLHACGNIRLPTGVLISCVLEWRLRRVPIL